MIYSPKEQPKMNATVYFIYIGIIYDTESSVENITEYHSTTEIFY